MSLFTFAEVNAKSLRLTETTTTLPEQSISSTLITLYNGTNRINITPTTLSSDAILAFTNMNLSGTSTGVTMVSTDNSSKLATTAFVKAQIPNFTGYAQTGVSQAWTATQNFSMVTATTPATSDNSSTVATTAFVKAQPAGLTLPIVLGTTGVLTTLGQSVIYSTSTSLLFNKTFNSTARAFAPSGLLAPGSYIAHVTVYANPVTYTVAVFGIAASATQMTVNQTTGLDYATYNEFGQEIGNVNITNGVLSSACCTVLTIVSSRPYISAYVSVSGSTNVGEIQLKLTRLS